MAFTEKIFIKFYSLVFKSSAGPTVSNFIRNFHHTLFGFGGAMVIVFIINIIAARILGPEEYGNYALVLTVSQFLVIPMMMGLNSALTRYLSQESSSPNQIIGTSFVSVLFLAYIFGTVFFLTRSGLSDLFNVSPIVFLFANLYALSFVLKRMAEATFRGFHDFKRQAWWEFLMALIIGLAFFILFFFDFPKNFTLYVNALMAGYIIYVLASLAVLLKKNLTFSKSALKTLLVFGTFGTGATVAAFILGHIDRLMLNSFLGPATVGFYMAYFTASMAIWSRLITLFINVLFPSAAKSGMQPIIYRQIMRGIKKLALPLFILIALGTLVLILFYGDQYPLRVDWILLFALQTLLYVIWTTGWWLITSEGKEGARFTSKHAIIGAGLNIAFNLFLIPFLGVNGALLATILSSLYFIWTVAKYYKFTIRAI